MAARAGSTARPVPSTQLLEHPLAEEARRLYANGLPFLQRHLPFWLANLIERIGWC